MRIKLFSMWKIKFKPTSNFKSAGPPAPLILKIEPSFSKNFFTKNNLLKTFTVPEIRKRNN